MHKANILFVSFQQALILLFAASEAVYGLFFALVMKHNVLLYVRLVNPLSFPLLFLYLSLFLPLLSSPSPLLIYPSLPVSSPTPLPLSLPSLPPYFPLSLQSFSFSLIPTLTPFPLLLTHSLKSTIGEQHNLPNTCTI